MDKEKCGKFGCYGYQDGYSHPQKCCKISGCLDADECSNELKEALKDKGKDYIMAIFQNKEKGINDRESEQKAREFEEKEKIRIAQEKMEVDKKEKEELKARASKVGLPETATKEEVEAKEKEEKLILVECQGCKEKIDYLGTVESGMGYIKCPKCGKNIDQTGKVLEEEIKEKEVTKPNPLDEIKDVVKVPRTVYDDKCPHCGELIHEKGVYSEDEGKTMRHGACKGKINIDIKAPEEKKEEKPAEVKLEEVKPKEEIKPEEKKEEVKPEEKKE